MMKAVSRSTALYAVITALFIVVFYVFHYLGNQIPYDLAQQRFSETFPKENAGNIPITGIDYKLGINHSWEFCEISGMVLAGAADESDPVTAALLLKQIPLQKSELDPCSELKDFSSRSGPPPWAFAKLRYWWGSRALFAMALHHLSVLEVHTWVRFATYGAYLLLAGACLLLGWRTLLVVAPVIVFGSLFSGLEFFADVGVGIPHIWAILAPAILTLLLRWENSTRWADLFCFVAGMVSAYLWLFDGHNFVCLALIGLVSWSKLSTGEKTFWMEIRRPLICVFLFIVGFIMSLVLNYIIENVVGALAGIKDIYSVSSNEHQVYSSSLPGVNRILDRIFTPHYGDLLGKDIASYWALISIGDMAERLQTYSSFLALVGAASLVGLQTRRGRKKTSFGVLWILALMLMAGMHFVLPNDLQYRAARLMFLPLALCWSCLGVALIQTGKPSVFVLGGISSAIFLSVLSVVCHHRYIVVPSIVAYVTEDARPLISSNFDVYHKDNQLIYARKDCEADDIFPMFFLHIDPVDKGDLPAHRRQHGFDNFDFSFSHNRVFSAQTCIAVVDLPAYDIATINTGQYSAGRQIWKEQIDVRKTEHPDTGLSN